MNLFLRSTLLQLDYILSFTEADALIMGDKLRLPFGGYQGNRSAGRQRQPTGTVYPMPGY